MHNTQRLSISSRVDAINLVSSKLMTLYDLAMTPVHDFARCISRQFEPARFCISNLVIYIRRYVRINKSTVCAGGIYCEFSKFCRFLVSRSLLTSYLAEVSYIVYHRLHRLHDHCNRQLDVF